MDSRQHEDSPCSPFPDEPQACEALTETGDLEAESLATGVKPLRDAFIDRLDAGFKRELSQ